MPKIFLTLVCAVCLAGCSSGPATTTNGRSVAADEVNTPSSRTDALSNSDPQAANRPPTRAEMMEKIRQKALNAPPSNIPPPKPQFKAAPENSVMSTTMNSEGAVIETRIFKNDPAINKVEMTWKGPNDNTLKIFLRNGRNIETKGDGIKDLGTMPVAVLRQMVEANPGK